MEQYPELASHVAKNEAEAAKESGNKAFSEKRCAAANFVFVEHVELLRAKIMHIADRSLPYFFA